MRPSDPLTAGLLPLLLQLVASAGGRWGGGVDLVVCVQMCEGGV